MISGLRSEVEEDRTLLGHYTASSGDSWPPTMAPIGCPETSVRNYHKSLRNNPEERSHYYLPVDAGCCGRSFHV